MNKLLAILSATLLTLSLQAQSRSTYITQMLVLKDKYDITFVYESSMKLDGTCRKVSDRNSLERSIRDLFEGSGIDYEIQGHTVILRKESRRAAPDYYEEPSWAYDTLRPSRIESAWVDTLAAAVKTDRMRHVKDMWTLRSDMPTIRAIVSPLGEGDPLRWVQTLPGVASGADGTSALYVRGGNLGNNLFTLDDVPVYGHSHILGLTTIIPTEAIEDIELSKGGFEGSQGNFISSHLRIRSRIPDTDKLHASVALNNFLASAITEGLLGNRVTYIVSGRVSPLTSEYKAIAHRLEEFRGLFKDFKADIGDIYGKVNCFIGGNSCLDAFILCSKDNYSFTNLSKDTMGWDNEIGSLGYTNEGEYSKTEVRIYANRYNTMQEENKLYSDTYQELSLRSQMEEYSFSANRTRRTRGPVSINYGFKVRDAFFNPGQIGSIGHKSNLLLSSAWLQGNLELPDKLSVMAAFRGNAFNRLDLDDEEISFIPDGGLSVKWSPVRHFSFGFTLDKASQFYHTLEGLPLGWSIDMVVPSGKDIGPETVIQAGLGLDLVFGEHNLSLGAFHRQMDGLVYYKYAPSLFSGALYTWEENVDIGQGLSYGAESLYEYLGKNFQARVSYTWSRTWREGFAGVLDGGRFHARFDRTHVLYATASWKGFNAAFTFQSGSWENGAGQKVTMHKVPGVDEEWEAEYFLGENDYHMPDIVRLDLGYRFSFEKGRLKHDLNLGVCNVTNHFNPFMLYYNALKDTWQEIALLPILPNFSYRITF